MKFSTIKMLCLAALFSATSYSTSAFSQDEKLTVKVLTKSAIKSLLGEYPAKGSPEEAQDFDELLKWQDTRTPEECELANDQHSAKISSMFAYKGGPLTEKEASRLEKRFLKEYAEVGLNILIAKKIYDRPRPYDANGEIKPCIELEGSSAYPSGHTTMARAMALFISTDYPERRAALIKAADQASLNRVIGGVHHPSDIVAGKKLGDALFKLITK